MDRPPNKPQLQRSKLLLVAAALLVAFTLVQVLGNALVWDDVLLIELFEGLRDPGRFGEIVTSSFWDNSTVVGANSTGYWRPLTSAILWLGGLLFDQWAPGFHLLSVIAALGAAASLALLLTRVSPQMKDRSIALWLGLLFLIHPLSAEVICMVANMSDHLGFTFLALQMVLLIDASRAPEEKWRWPLVALFALLACCSKELGVLAAGAPLAAWWVRRATNSPGQLSGASKLLPWIVSVGPALLYLLARNAVLDEGIGQSVSDYADLGPDVFFLGWGQALTRIIVPLPNGAHTFVGEGDTLQWVTSAVAWLALGALLGWAWLKKNILSVTVIGCLMAVALFLPSMLTVDMSEGSLRFPTRYFHLPLAGLLIAVVPFVVRNWARGLRLALPAFVVLLTLLSWIRISEWTDNISFYSAEVGYHPDILYDRINLTQALAVGHAFTEANKIIAKIEAHPLRDDPWVASKVANTKGKIAYMAYGDLETATRLLKKAVEIAPDNMEFILDLATIRAASGNRAEARSILSEALKTPSLNEHGREVIQRIMDKLDPSGIGKEKTRDKNR